MKQKKPKRTRDNPGYPLLAEHGVKRRHFLALIAAGAAATMLPGCKTKPDESTIAEQPDKDSNTAPQTSDSLSADTTKPPKDTAVMHPVAKDSSAENPSQDSEEAVHDEKDTPVRSPGKVSLPRRKTLKTKNPPPQKRHGIRRIPTLTDYK